VSYLSVGDFGSNWEAGWPSRKPKLTNNQMRRKYSRSAIWEKLFSFLSQNLSFWAEWPGSLKNRITQSKNPYVPITHRDIGAFPPCITVKVHEENATKERAA